jgi:hypothetical protein
MILQNYYLGDTISKTTEHQRLWETEKGIVEIEKNTLAIPVMLNGSLEGYAYHGHGKLVLDLIVETKEGAVGKPIEKEIRLPFLMLGNAEKMQHSLNPASQEDFSEMGYAKHEEFVAEAEDLLGRFSRRGILNCRHSGDGSVFAFQNEANKLDILVAKGAKLVYKTIDMVFVSNMDRTVLKSPSGVVCVSRGKSVIMRR